MKTSLRLVAAAAAFVGLSGTAFAQAQISQSKINGWPYVISQPGHYKLTGNLVVPQAMGGIKITAPDVTLDLNGFTISGPNVCTRNASTFAVNCALPGTAGTHGIYVLAPGAVVRNGTVRGFDNVGIFGAGFGLVVEGVTVSHNYTGIAATNSGSAPMAGMNTRITASIATLNATMGIAADAALVERSRASLNGGDGFNVFSGTVIDSYAGGNGARGVAWAAVRGTRLTSNKGGNVVSTISLGGNLNESAVF
jgi:hypothetical protein